MYEPKWLIVLILDYIGLFGTGFICFLYRLYFELSSPYKGDSARFSLNLESWKRGLKGVESGYPTSMNIPRVDGLSTDTSVLGRHNMVSEHRYTST